VSKIDLVPITSGYNLSKINANFQKVEDELNNKVLYRDSPAGEPNSMSSNLDMNSKSVLNAHKISSNILELGGVQVVPANLAIDPYNGTREALRRSYAEAGYNLVDGSFEVGGTLVNANDVLLHEASGKAFHGPAGTVPAGTDPSLGLFILIDTASSLLKIPTIADLKSTDGYEDGQIAFLLGNSINGVGSGYYRFYQVPPLPDNGGAVVYTPSGGAWVLISALCFEHFGVTDAQVDQAPKIMSAIHYAESVGIRLIRCQSIKTIYLGSTFKVMPVDGRRYSTHQDTSVMLTLDFTGVVFRPLVDNLTMIRVLRESTNFPEINGHGSGHVNTTLLVIGDQTTGVWDNDPNARRSYSHITVARLRGTSLAYGVRFKPLVLGAETIGCYYHEIGDVWFRAVAHGVVFDNCPTGNNQTTRTHFGVYNHNGGVVGLMCNNVETLIVDSMSLEAFTGGSTEFPEVSGHGVYLPSKGAGQELRNHRVKITGSTEQVDNPFFCQAIGCDLDIYPVSYLNATWDSDMYGHSGYGGIGAMPQTKNLNDFYFLYQTSRQAVVSIAPWSSGAASLPDGMTQCYGNVEWLPCSNIMTTEGIQILRVSYPTLSVFCRKCNISASDNTATFTPWARSDIIGGLPAINAAIDASANTLKAPGAFAVYTVQYTAWAGGAAFSPTGGEFYGSIQWNPSVNGEGTQIAYGTYPYISRKRTYTSGSWSPWIDL